jgi:hypothetical protein
MRVTRDKIGDARGRPKRRSSLLRHPNAKFFAETGGTGTNKQKGTQPWGQDFFPGVTTLRNPSQGKSALLTTVRSSVQLMAGFEVTINGRFWGDHGGRRKLLIRQGTAGVSGFSGVSIVSKIPSNSCRSDAKRTLWKLQKSDSPSRCTGGTAIRILFCKPQKQFPSLRMWCQFGVHFMHCGRSSAMHQLLNSACRCAFRSLLARVG